MADLVLRKSEWLDDWYVIELATDGPREERLVQHSARIGDADVEGTAAEMLRIAEAIEDGDTYSAKRCAVRFVDGAVELWSPRNSMSPGRVSPDDARSLAAEIRRQLGGAS